MDDAETLRLLALQSLRRKADELEEGEVRVVLCTRPSRARARSTTCALR